MLDYSIIIGLGNPGKNFRNNRHNVGFQVLDTIVNRFDLDIVKKKLLV